MKKFLVALFTLLLNLVAWLHPDLKPFVDVLRVLLQLAKTFKCFVKLLVKKVKKKEKKKDDNAKDKD